MRQPSTSKNNQYWQEEYARYCEEKGLAVGNESAAEFVRFKDEQLEAAMERGDA